MSLLLSSTEPSEGRVAAVSYATHQLKGLSQFSVPLLPKLHDGRLQYLSPLGWDHFNITGDYLWRSNAKIGAGKFRPLRPLQ